MVGIQLTEFPLEARIGHQVTLAARRRGRPAPAPPAVREISSVSLIIAAHREEPVIAAKVRNALALDWPAESLQVIVAVDGGAQPDADRTAQRAREAGAHLVLELPRGGKVRAQDAAVAHATGELLAFSDANATWAPEALQHLVADLADLEVAYVCGRLRLEDAAGSNREGLYWRYELWLREQESRLGSITVPTLVVASDQDYTPVERKKEYARKIRDARVVVVKDSRHALPIEEPEKLQPILDAFLAEHGETKGGDDHAAPR